MDKLTAVFWLLVILTIAHALEVFLLLLVMSQFAKAVTP